MAKSNVLSDLPIPQSRSVDASAYFTGLAEPNSFATQHSSRLTVSQSVRQTPTFFSVRRTVPCLLLSRFGTALEAPDPVPEAQARVPSTSASPAPGAGARARSSSATAGKKNQKRKKIELTLPESSDEDDDGGGDLRAKIARLEGENARLRGGVKAEPGVKIKDEPKVKKEKYKTTQENGKVVLDLLDE